MSQMRILSAGRCEAERTNWALRDSVLRLEEELTATKFQLSKVTNEFGTLVLLVKRFVLLYIPYFIICRN